MFDSDLLSSTKELRETVEFEGVRYIFEWCSIAVAFSFDKTCYVFACDPIWMRFSFDVLVGVRLMILAFHGIPPKAILYSQFQGLRFLIASFWTSGHRSDFRSFRIQAVISKTIAFGGWVLWISVVARATRKGIGWIGSSHSQRWQQHWNSEVAVLIFFVGIVPLLAPSTFYLLLAPQCQTITFAPASNQSH